MTVIVEGHGFSVGFGTTTAYNAELVSFDLPERTRNAIESHHQSSSLKTTVPGKTVDPGESSLEFVYDPSMPDLVAVDAEEDVTITFPQQAGETAPGSIAFKAFAIAQGGEGIATDGRITQKVNLKVNSNYTYTAPTTT